MSFLKNNTFTFTETDPNKIGEILNPIFEDKDLEEEDYDSGDDEEEEEEDSDDTPTESYKSIVPLTPPSNTRPMTETGQSPFGENTTQQYPFGNSGFAAGNSGYRSLGTYQPNYGFASNPVPRPTTGFGTTNPFGSTNYGGFGSTSYGNTSSYGWGNNYSNQSKTAGMYGYGQSNYRKIQVPRNCRILFCELNDVLVGPKWFSPEGGEEIFGLDPRGIYDLAPKYPVWDVIRQMNPEYVFIITNQPAELGTIEAQEMGEFIMETANQLARFLRLPSDRCRSFVKFGLGRNKFTKPNTGLLTEALRTIRDINRRFTRDQIYMMGAQSGNLGESDVDIKTAENFGIQYIPVRGIVG